jgi:hypothetical protein
MLRIALLIAIAVLAFATPADAGFFDAFRFRSTPRGTVMRLPNVQGKAAVKFKYECGPSGCRLVPVSP